MANIGHICSICKEIRSIGKGTHPLFIAELQTGYVVLGDYQFYPGYTIFLCKIHADELHELPRDFRMQFLRDMSIASEAVYRAFKPKKLNYELLGNTVSHLHWHIFPRYAKDPIPQRPVWCIDSSITCGPKTRPSKTTVSRYAAMIRREIRMIAEG